MNKKSENLALAIANKTTTRLDVAGLSVETYGPYLGEIYQMIGRAYLADLILKLPSIGELLKHYECENLQWTTTPPTKPGWYWVCKKGSAPALKEYKGVVTDVFLPDVSWLGPLPIPEEPKQEG